MKTTENNIVDKRNIFISNYRMAWMSIMKQAIVTSVIIAIISIVAIIIFGNITLEKINYWAIIGYTFLYSLPLFMINAILFEYIDYRRNFNWKKPISRIIEGVFWSGIVSGLLGCFLIVIDLFANDLNKNEVLEIIFSVKMIPAVQRIVWISTTISTTFYIFNYIKFSQKRKTNLQELKKEKIQSEHQALKSQIGPHFLFNSLNVLNGLIDENKDKAQEFVSELSSVYRYVLEQNEKSTVSLEDEVAFAEKYLNLVKKRFEEALQYEFKLHASDLQAYEIVPLSLQILLENCIKHNIASNEKPLKISIEIEHMYLKVSNNFQPKKHNSSIGMGLESIQKRYELLTPNPMKIVETQSIFSVEIPLLNSFHKS